MPKKDLPAYYEVRDSIKHILDQIEFKEFPQEETSLEGENAESNIKTASQNEISKPAI